MGFAITKVVVNATGEAWSLFDIELQEVYGIASDYYDGLSFGNRRSCGGRFCLIASQSANISTNPMTRSGFARAPCRRATG